MISSIAFKLNRKIKSKYVYNLLSWLYFSYLKLRKLMRYGTADMFDMISIETTSSCNRGCSYCPVSKFRRNAKLIGIPLFKKIIMQLSEMGFKGTIAHHFYGEPLLDKRLELFIQHEKSILKHTNVIIYSNGDKLNRRRFYRLVDAGTDLFYITMHEGKVSRKLTYLYRNLPLRDRSRIKLRILSNSSVLSSRGNLVSVKNKQIKLFCALPANEFIITAFGDVVLCCDDYFGSVKWGNIRHESIKEIWNKGEFREVRKELSKGQFRYNICKSCIR